MNRELRGVAWFKDLKGLIQGIIVTEGQKKLSNLVRHILLKDVFIDV